MITPEKREYFRIGVRLPIEFRTITREEYLELERAVACSADQRLNSLKEADFIRELVANDDTRENKGRIYAYVRMIDKKLDMILDVLTRPGDEGPYISRNLDVNIGGAGMRFVSDVKLRVGAYVELRAILPMLPYPKITALCQVTRSKTVAQPDVDPNWEVALKFLTIHEDDRDLLIRYIFARERESLRNKKKVNG